MKKNGWSVALVVLLTVSLGASCSGAGEPAEKNPPAPMERTAGQTGRPNGSPSSLEKPMKLTIKTGKDELTATLYDNAAAKDFLTLLPMTITLEDYNGTEKIGQLPKRLSREGLAAGYDPSEGDIAWYAPWGNLCIFYRDFGYSTGLVPLGRIDGDGIGKFRIAGPVTVTITLSE